MSHEHERPDRLFSRHTFPRSLSAGDPNDPDEYTVIDGGSVIGDGQTGNNEHSYSLCNAGLSDAGQNTAGMEDIMTWFGTLDLTTRGRLVRSLISGFLQQGESVWLKREDGSSQMLVGEGLASSRFGHASDQAWGSASYHGEDFHEDQQPRNTVLRYDWNNIVMRHHPGYFDKDDFHDMERMIARWKEVLEPVPEEYQVWRNVCSCRLQYFSGYFIRTTTNLEIVCEVSDHKLLRNRGTDPCPA